MEHTQESVGWYKMENKVETEDYKTVVSIDYSRDQSASHHDGLE